MKKGKNNYKRRKNKTNDLFDQLRVKYLLNFQLFNLKRIDRPIVSKIPTQFMAPFSRKKKHQFIELSKYLTLRIFRVLQQQVVGDFEVWQAHLTNRMAFTFCEIISPFVEKMSSLLKLREKFLMNIPSDGL